MHSVVVLAIASVDELDLANAAAVFTSTVVDTHYSFDVCTGTDWPVDSGAGFTLSPTRRLDTLKRADTVLVAGYELHESPGKPVTKALQSAARAGARLAGLGTGVFALGWAGLLAGRNVTTHWASAEELAARFPETNVDRRRLIVRDGELITGAGGAAGLELCIDLVREDLGSVAATAVAKELVMASARGTEQVAFAATAQTAPRSLELIDTCTWALERLASGVSVEEMAVRAQCSTRTLHRWFLDELGVAPLRWLIDRRIERARTLLETSDLSIEDVAKAVGLGSASAFRAQFRRSVGRTPLAYRALYQ
jgi:AraC family transcriptional activator FtrA